MIRMPTPKAPFCLAASLVLALVLPAPAGAQATRREGTPAEQVSSWQTTTHIQLPPLKRSVFPLATGSLQPHKVPNPAVPLMGQNHTMKGLASFYWQEQKTSSGETFDRMAMTAAHKTLPFGTHVRVTNLDNGRSVVVRINDRGPFKPGRVIDLSYAAAGVIDMRGKGLAPVRIDVVK